MPGPCVCHQYETKDKTTKTVWFRSLKARLKPGTNVLSFSTQEKTAEHAPCKKCLWDMVSTITRSTEQRSLLVALDGDDAQHMVDFMNWLLKKSDNQPRDDKRTTLSALCDLAGSARVCPRCYIVRGIQRSNSRVTGGSYGDVYKGVFNEHVLCVKVIRINRQHDAADILRILQVHIREIVLWGQLAHHNILPFYGAYYLEDEQIQGRICLVSPWIKNGTLCDFLKRYPRAARIPLVHDIADALAYLHQAQIVHGDLKANNVLVSNQGRALLADFGLARVTTSNGSNSDNLPNGTTRWKAPELVRAEDVNFPSPTPESDVWSFSCLCYEVFIGKVPFYQYKSDYKVIAVLLSDEPQEIPICPTTGCAPKTEEMWNLMIKCWDYAPENRPTSQDLQVILAGFSTQDTRNGHEQFPGDDPESWTAMRANLGEVNFKEVERILPQIQGETAKSVL